MDPDGAHVAGLLMGFICKFLPEYKDKLYRLHTPVKGAMKDGKLVRWTFDLEGSIDIKSGESLMYFKGLGTLDPSDIEVIVKDGGLDAILYRMDLDVEGFEEAMEAWLGDDADTRKRLILANDFNIAVI